MVKNNDYSLNFSIFRKQGSWDANAISNIMAEVYLNDEFLYLDKNSLVKRKKLGFEKIKYSNIYNLDLEMSKLSSLSLAINISYLDSKGSDSFISLRNGDGFAVKWFYEKLTEKIELANSNNECTLDLSNSEDIDDDNDLDKTKNFIKRMKEPISDKESSSIKRQTKFYNCSHNEF